jgi:hypothetical protein
MLTLAQLDELAHSPDHDGHIARVILSIVKDLKLGELTLGQAKYKVGVILKNYEKVFHTLPNYELLQNFKNNYKSNLSTL